MACAGFFGVPGAEGCTLVRVSVTWFPCGDAAWTVLVAYWNFWGFPCTLVSEFWG